MYKGIAYVFILYTNRKTKTMFEIDFYGVYIQKKNLRVTIYFRYIGLICYI